MFGRNLLVAGNHLILTLAVAAMIAPEASGARSTSVQLQATLVVLTSCNFSSLGVERYEHANRVLLGPRVSCNTEIAPVTTYSKEMNLTRLAIRTSKEITVMTMYFF